MPGVSRTQRAEAKYNVTLEFPHLGLHSAASSGNLGLVTYALDHGQPVNSVVDGVLPLHVASSGGNDLIVRLLIERGADVNAPRLPRKYSSDRHRDASAPIVGTSGSTPLHFAAANGHEQVVHTLLLHGAHPDRADKHGVTPEMLARQNGWTTCADLLSQWTHVKDKDLRERELSSSVPASDYEPASRLESLECKVIEKKLKVKRSIDNALHMLRPSLPTPPSSGHLPSDASYTASPPPITESTSIDSSPETSFAQEDHPRRPSLPHIFDPAVYSQSRSHNQNHTHHHSKSPGRPSFSSSRRPRSAGTDAEPSTPASVSAAAASGRLRGKISLLHMFKKSTTGDASSTAASTPGLPATPDSRDSLSGYASSSSAFTSASGSPAPEREPDRSRGSLSQSPLRARASESGLLSSASSSSPYLTTIPSSRSRLASEGSQPPSHVPGAATDAAFPPLAVELHMKLSAERLRARSGSGSSSSGTTEARVHLSSPPTSQLQPPSQSQLQGHRSPPMRPGILRPHHRSTSSSQSQVPPLPQAPASAQSGESSARSLRFDSSASAQSASSRKRSGLNIKVSNSVSSLRGSEGRAAPSGDSPRSPRHPSFTSTSSNLRLRETHLQGTASPVPATGRTVSQALDDDDEEGYGEVIAPRLGLGLEYVQGDGKSRLNELKSGERRRRPSAGSQISHESSPLPSPTVPSAPSGFDCPFSINRPPPQPLQLDSASSSQSQSQQSQSSGANSRSNTELLTIHHVDNRTRGDSIGSMSTSTDASASAPQTPLPAAGASLGVGLDLQIRSPEAITLDLLPAVELPPSVHDTSGVDDAKGKDVDVDVANSRSRTDSSVSMPEDSDTYGYALPSHRRAPPPPPLPLDIDIRAISSHAQAEALVQRAQKSILEMDINPSADVDLELPGLLASATGSGGSAGLGLGLVGAVNGRTPLSAKLAAYGESLAIERRFKEQEQERERGGRGRDGETPFGSPTTPSGRNAAVAGAGDGARVKPRHSEMGLRKFSLEEQRPSEVRHPRRSRPRRPHTADGETQDASPGFLSPGHKPSLSGSVLLHSSSRSSISADDNHSQRATPSSARTLPIVSSPPSGTLSPPRIVRSRTPDPDSRYLSASPPSSANYPRASSPSPSASPPFGVPLSRVSTAPPRHASPELGPQQQRSLSGQERQLARAKKLTKMGIAAYDSFPRAHSPYGHARNGGGGSGGGSIGGGLGLGGGAGMGGGALGKPKFGGFKGFVQTLKGKS
ncbi:hypothetical protein C8Q73DRAFT_665247 [Cubamyces lactineus]|nr:hypothetical protein C8Q73DRAFT_665247 [Cubamyces lactineus]